MDNQQPAVGLDELVQRLLELERVSRAQEATGQIDSETTRQAEQLEKDAAAVGISMPELRRLSVDMSVDMSVDIESGPGAAFVDVFSPETYHRDEETRGLDELILEQGGVSPELIESANRVVSQSPGRTLADVLIEQGADEEPIRRALAKHAGLDFERVDLDKGLDGGFDGGMMQRLSPAFCKQHQVLPLRFEGNRPVIGAISPDAVFLLEEIREKLGSPTPSLSIIPAFDIKGALEIIGEGEEDRDTSEDIADILDEVDEGDVAVDEKGHGQEVDLEQQAGESPVIRYVNYIIQQAVREGASDIHIEPAEKKLKVRYRIDGVLFEAMNPPAAMSAAITSRIKIMANLDISERRLPQDGRIRCTVQGRKLDLRVSTLPNAAGEKTVMRILDTRSINVELNDLGFSDAALTMWQRLIKLPHGIVLVTGPTGSGKTTTLYSSLRQLDKNKLNISTVEDPVEYHLDGVTQTQMHEKIGMTFAKALKALLRQDPDVIMLGEIRDLETAHTAVQAALTGHLVLSTLHTNDAPSSVTRLVNIGLEPFLVAAAVQGVLAQRLVRRLCPKCKELQEPTEELAEFMAMNGLGEGRYFGPVGCDKCRKVGYSGRVGIYELLMVSDQLRDIIAGNPNVSEFRRMCVDRGMISLRQDGFDKVGQGLTTVEEVLRVADGGH